MKLSVTILCTDPAHPVNPWLQEWARQVADRAEVRLTRDVSHLTGGDILFLVSCQQIVRKPDRERFGHTLVLHASKLPQGRGMSPHVWQVLEGCTELTVSLLDAEDAVDTGAIWRQATVAVEPTDLYEEIHARLFDAETALMTWAIDNVSTSQPRIQQGEPSYYRRRTPEDSRVDIDKPLREYLNLLRISDPQRYPAFFEYAGQKYRIRLDKL